MRSRKVVRAQQLASTPTVEIRSFMKVDGDLIPIEEFQGPIIDRLYIEGAIEMSVGRQTLLSRDMVDYIDQLWAYLVEGLGEVMVGREFSTCYPDMPLTIVLRPQGDRVAIKVGSRAEVSVMRNELCRALVSAGTVFFERLRRFESVGDRYLRILAELTTV